MAAPTYHNASAITASSDYMRHGYPGKYHSAFVVATTETASFTGSNYGYGAILLGNGADDGATKISVAGSGAIIAGSDLSTERIYDISVDNVQCTGGNIFLFKRQQ
jgi:hypothetical protein